MTTKPIVEVTTPKGYYSERIADTLPARILPTNVAKLIEEARAPLLAAIDKAEEALSQIADCRIVNGKYASMPMWMAMNRIAGEALATIHKVKGDR